MHIVERFLLSKRGDEDTCEDAVFVGDCFCAVIDGATSKTDFEIEGYSPGATAARLIQSELANLSPKIGAAEAVAQINHAVGSYLSDRNLSERLVEAPELRPTASIAIYSKCRNQVWTVGDCQCALDGRVHQNGKRVDSLFAELRAFILEHELLRGRTVAYLQEHDVGREYILPALNRQYGFQNHDADSDFAYAAIDGFGSPEKHVCVLEVDDECQNVVLASDGYPFLKPTLKESEQLLQAILDEDPLLIFRYKSTKGLREGFVSFDDRAYIRLRPANNARYAVDAGAPKREC